MFTTIKLGIHHYLCTQTLTYQFLWSTRPLVRSVNVLEHEGLSHQVITRMIVFYNIGNIIKLRALNIYSCNTSVFLNAVLEVTQTIVHHSTVLYTMMK